VPRKDLAAEWETRNPLRRVGKHEELTDLAAYLMSDRSGYINGDCITIDGGEWLHGAGQFTFLERLTAADWEELKPKK
jgi:enoyl-[acyl-carrier-protein] reductase (NADH)